MMEEVGGMAWLREEDVVELVKREEGEDVVVVE